MRFPRLALVLACGLSCAACFQMSTVVKIEGDGSGTIDHQMVFTTAALQQIRQFAALGGGRGGRGGTLDLVSEDQARSMASSLGSGVTYVSSTPINTPEGQGRLSTYAFADVSQIKITQQPDAPGGMTVRAQGLNTGGGTITCSMTHEANGNAVLHVILPEPSLPGADAAGGNAAFVQQVPMIRSILANARVSIVVEPAGRLVRTNSPFVDGRRVTLLDLNLDDLLGNDALLAKLQSAKSADDLRAALKEAPGIRMVLDKEVTIEFTPGK
jgi:hypothetical protein